MITENNEGSSSEQETRAGKRRAIDSGGLSDQTQAPPVAVPLEIWEEIGNRIPCMKDFLNYEIAVRKKGQKSIDMLVRRSNQFAKRVPFRHSLSEDVIEYVPKRFIEGICKRLEEDLKLEKENTLKGCILRRHAGQYSATPVLPSGEMKGEDGFLLRFTLSQDEKRTIDGCWRDIAEDKWTRVSDSLEKDLYDQKKTGKMDEDTEAHIEKNRRRGMAKFFRLFYPPTHDVQAAVQSQGSFNSCLKVAAREFPDDLLAQDEVLMIDWLGARMDFRNEFANWRRGNPALAISASIESLERGFRERIMEFPMRQDAAAKHALMRFVNAYITKYYNGDYAHVEGLTKEELGYRISRETFDISRSLNTLKQRMFAFSSLLDSGRYVDILWGSPKNRDLRTLLDRVSGFPSTEEAQRCSFFSKLSTAEIEASPIKSDNTRLPAFVIKENEHPETYKEAKKRISGVVSTPIFRKICEFSEDVDPLHGRKFLRYMAPRLLSGIESREREKNVAERLKSFQKSIKYHIARSNDVERLQFVRGLKEEPFPNELDKPWQAFLNRAAFSPSNQGVRARPGLSH